MNPKNVRGGGGGNERGGYNRDVGLGKDVFLGGRARGSFKRLGGGVNIQKRCKKNQTLRNAEKKKKVEKEGQASWGGGRSGGPIQHRSRQKFERKRKNKKKKV